METIPEDFEAYGMSRDYLLEIMDWVQARFDEGNLEVDDPAEWEDGQLFKVIDGGGEYDGTGYSIEVEDIDVWEDDVYQYRYLKFGTTWSSWSEEKPMFTDVKAGQDKYTVEVRLMAGNGAFLKQHTGYVKITPKPVTITVHDKEKWFGEDDPEFTGEIDGVLDTSELEVSYKRQGDGYETIGEEEVGFWQSRIVATYVFNPNYDVTVNLGDFTIKELIPEPTEPEPTQPEPTEPEPPEPELTEPEPTVPAPIEPEVTEPEETEEITEPETTEPEIAEPEETKPIEEEAVDEYGLPRTNESGIYLVAGLAFLAVAGMGIVVRRKVK